MRICDGRTAHACNVQVHASQVAGNVWLTARTIAQCFTRGAHRHILYLMHRQMCETRARTWRQSGRWQRQRRPRARRPRVWRPGRSQCRRG